jgi:hypothetical protein
LVAETDAVAEVALSYADDELAAIVATWEKKQSGVAGPSPVAGPSGGAAS